MADTTHTIEEIAVPAELDSPDAADFLATVDVRNAIEVAVFGADADEATAVEMHPNWLDQTYEPKRLFVARVEGRVVARAIYETRPASEGRMAWVLVQVHPDFRRRGIGSALADRIEALCAEEGRDRLIVYTPSADGPGPRIQAPTGFGSVPADNDEVRFLLARGFALEQVERGSRLSLPVDAGVLDGLLAQASDAAGKDYRLHLWTGNTPDRWIDDMAVLYTRMSTDAPSAGLDEPEDVWTRERLLDYEARHGRDPQVLLLATVEHVPSGHLVGLTELGVAVELDRPVSQHDTIVLREHRGHRLGMLLKIANLQNLEQQAPGHQSVLTFNAEENRHMLSVNEAVGFVPIGYEGAWKKAVG